MIEEEEEEEEVDEVGEGPVKALLVNLSNKKSSLRLDGFVGSDVLSNIGVVDIMAEEIKEVDESADDDESDESDDDDDDDDDDIGSRRLFLRDEIFFETKESVLEEEDGRSIVILFDTFFSELKEESLLPLSVISIKTSTAVVVRIEEDDDPDDGDPDDDTIFPSITG